MKYKTVNKGFTLIELLVVIAIIGLLSSIVMSSLGGAKLKAKDTAVKENIREMQKIIELSRNTGNKSNYNDTGLWVSDYAAKDCSNLGGDMATEARRVCEAIYKIGVGDFGNPGAPNQFLMGIHEMSPSWAYKGPRYDAYSITARLNSGKYYCLSNLGSYEGDDPWGLNNPCYYYRTP